MTVRLRRYKTLMWYLGWLLFSRCFSIDVEIGGDLVMWPCHFRKPNGSISCESWNLWKPRIWKKTWERQNPHVFPKSKNFTRNREYSDYNDISVFHHANIWAIQFKLHDFWQFGITWTTISAFFQVWQRSPNLHRKIEKSRGFQPDCFFFGTKFRNALKSQRMVFPVVLKLATETPSLNAKSISTSHCFIHRLDRKMMKRVLYSLYTPYTISLFVG